MQKKLRELQRIKEEQNQKELEECTFKPKINSEKSKSVQSKVFDIDSYNEKLKNYEKLKKQREMEELRQLESYRKKPSSESYDSLNNNSNITTFTSSTASTNSKPIYERLGDIQRELIEKEKLRKQQQYEEERKQLRSAPTISETSKKIVASMKNRVPITERIAKKQGEEDHQTLYEKEKQNRKYLQTKSEEVEDCTFHPNINEVSKKITEMRMNSDFLQRQEMYQLREKKKKDFILKQEEKSLVFKPKISKTSEELCKSDMHRSNSGQDIYERLTYRDKKRNDHVKEATTQEYYSKFSFVPKINQVSSLIAAPTDLDELVNNTRNKKIKQEIALRVLEKENYRFQPTLISNNEKYLPSERGPNEIITESERFLREKEMKRAKAIMEIECQQLSQCTFQPQINEKVQTNQEEGPILIRGLGKHLERGEKAKRLAEEKKEREEEVFKAKVYSKKIGNVTIPEPFKFGK
ncbi:hypothetical protein ABK040_001440 [Willaertia magna]